MAFLGGVHVFGKEPASVGAGRSALGVCELRSAIQHSHFSELLVQHRRIFRRAVEIKMWAKNVHVASPALN